ncbi:MAG: signal peptidase I [Verrucomicrobia bacterium]|nr:signal peptidase I [Verrucomicrobiota bacterium]
MKRRTRILCWLLATVVVLFVLSRFVARPCLIVGESMAPTLRSWDLCLMQRVYQYQPQRADIVMFRTADDPPIHFIKRVIGLPGETVAVSNGVVQLNGASLPEPYATNNSDWTLIPTNVPPDRVFVIGDNRAEGGTETWHGFVATRLVIGKLIWQWRWKQ